MGSPLVRRRKYSTIDVQAWAADARISPWSGTRGEKHSRSSVHRAGGSLSWSQRIGGHNNDGAITNARAEGIANRLLDNFAMPSDDA